MAATIYDVAKLAGVGIGTVSRAINGSPQIRPETKERVMQAVRTLGYAPHVAAQHLARKRIGMLVAIMPSYSGHFYQELLRGVQHSLAKYDYDLIVYFVDKFGKLETYLERTLNEKRSDGVLVISMDISDEYVNKFETAGLPLVIVDRAHEKVDSIEVENEMGAYLATRHLIATGHTRIAMIAAHSQSNPAAQRYQGYRRALEEANIRFDPELYLSADMLGSDETLQYNDGFNETVGHKAMERLLALNSRRPTAVFACCDIQAVGAMKAIQAASLKIPEEVSIIGFDDIELAGYLALTTMQQPMYEMGILAIERMMAKIEGQQVRPRHIRLETRLVKRRSTAVVSVTSDR